MPLRVIGEDLVGDDVARDQASEDSRADDRAPRRRARIEFVATRAHDGHEGRRCILSAWLAEISGEEPHEIFEVADHRTETVLLDAEVIQDRNAAVASDTKR